MKKILSFIFNPIISTLIIYGLLILCFFIPHWISSLRFSDYKWIWSYGNKMIKALIYFLFSCSLILPMIIWLKNRNIFKKKLLWVVAGFLPAVYFLTPFILSKQR